LARVVVGSRNPVKIVAVHRAFRRMFPDEPVEIEAVSAPSGVADQPASSEEALAGARGRAREAARLLPEVDYWVGIEGGVEDTSEGMAAFAWVVVRNRQAEGKGRSGTFFLPAAVADLVRAGKELGEADDIVFGRKDSKRQEGAIGILTRGVIDRAALYEHAVVLALVTFVGGEEPSLSASP